MPGGQSRRITHREQQILNELNIERVSAEQLRLAAWRALTVGSPANHAQAQDVYDQAVARIEAVARRDRALTALTQAISEGYLIRQERDLENQDETFNFSMP